MFKFYGFLTLKGIPEITGLTWAATSGTRIRVSLGALPGMLSAVRRTTWQKGVML